MILYFIIYLIIIVLSFYSLYSIFGHYTLSTLIASAFGRQLNITKGEGEQIAKALSLLMTSYTERTALYMTEVIICEDINHYTYLTSC